MIPLHAAVILAPLFGIVQGDCEDTDNGATDIRGWSCYSYTTYPYWCHYYDHWDFQSGEMCCACGGGSGSGGCVDTDYGAVNQYNMDCGAYNTYGANNGWCASWWYDDYDFSSSDMCCGCGGGAPAPPPPTPAPTSPPLPTPAPTPPPPTPAPTPPPPTTSTQISTTATQTATSSETAIQTATQTTTETGTSFSTSSSTATTEMVLTATTALVRSVLAGSQELVVESEEGFSVGDAIMITGGGNSETRDITSFGSMMLGAPLDYGYPAGSRITNLGVSFSSNSPSAEEPQDSEASLAVFVAVVIVLLACVALGLGCLMRRGCPGCGRGPARDSQIEISVSELDAEISEHQADQKTELLETMDFWFLPVEALMNMPRNIPVFRHQVLRDLGLLVKRTMTLEDVLAGRFVADTAAVSHRWPEPEHPDPDGSKLCELQDILAKIPSIKFVWMDWVCAPQWHCGGRTEEEEEEFRLILENILPFIFLGCTVIVLYERVYNQRFWPNVESWIATKMATEDGLVPATEDRLRLKVHGIDSVKGFNCTPWVLDSWHHADAQLAICILSHKDILVTNAKDKDVNLKVLGSLDHMIKSRHILCT
ncbi:unnamed protein product [Prorocentrum cordatum]|uniref:Heterokaryon incompatibility domain-containing protein n=1 Tax=Prorocentrum cordatum TaxID=2364126 RepID=A0ABN9V1D0_9DINO|nr:unnamed protein product [Polarella glacialis]